METKSPSDKKTKKNRLFRKLNKREKTLAIVVLAALLVGVWLPERIIVATSPSLNHRIFFLTPVNAKNIRNGDYLVFRHQDPETMKFLKKGLKENDRLVKRVGCVPGNLLFKDDGGFHCSIPGIDGEELFLGKTLQRDGEDRKLPQFDFTGFVPDDSYFMVGTNPRSFDSRYFGFIHADAFLYKALPLW